MRIAVTHSGDRITLGSTTIGESGHSLTVVLSGGSALPDSTAVTVIAGNTLKLGSSETIGSLAGAGSVDLGANTLITGGNGGSCG